MVPIREEEARYLVIQLVNKYPGLTDLLFKLQGAGTGWVRLLQVLEQAVYVFLIRYGLRKSCA
jgi:hypothetical protein